MGVVRLPGLIDVHVHLRDPGGTHKEDFASGGRAALRGGVTRMFDMPNNIGAPTTTLRRLEDKVRRARAATPCRIGFHFGTDGRNLDELAGAAAHPDVGGLKVYFDPTTGDLNITDLALLDPIFAAWESSKPILVHAEGTSLAAAIGLAAAHARRLHVCHVSRAAEVDLLRAAKARGLPVTAGVCPHHLFLTEADTAETRLGSRARMKPELGGQADQDALWAGVRDRTLDLVETDHAPHTADEKRAGSGAPFGVPGLETALGLMLLAVERERLTTADVVRLMHDAPASAFDLEPQADTWIEVDPEETWVVGATPHASRAGWSPFDGWTLHGPVRRAAVGGRIVIDDPRGDG